MKELDEILKKIRDTRDYYDNMTLEDTKMLSQVLRSLTNNLFYLAEHRITAHEKWLSVYHTHKQNTSNAEAERMAEKQVPELYMIRHLMTSGYKLVDIIRSQIGIYKQES